METTFEVWLQAIAAIGAIVWVIFMVIYTGAWRPPIIWVKNSEAKTPDPKATPRRPFRPTDFQFPWEACQPAAGDEATYQLRRTPPETKK